MVMKMNKMMIATVMAGFLLTGCSVEDLTSKSEKFASQAEALGEKIVDVKETFESLENRKTLSQKDQQLIVSELEALSDGLDLFEKEDAPLLAKAMKKMAVKELTKREKTLNRIKEKAQKGEAGKDDVEEVLALLSDDFGIREIVK
jgi:outer membrane murein-binding lipoprotein Lpp